MTLPAFDRDIALPPEPDVTSLLSEIRLGLEDPASRLLVLDDDPTGVQTMQNIEILTTWEPDLVDRTLQEQSRILYLLTNSRALDEAAAVKLTASVVAILRSAAQKKSDSVLPDQQKRFNLARSLSSRAEANRRFVAPASRWTSDRPGLPRGRQDRVGRLPLCL